MLQVERIRVHYGAAPALYDVSLTVDAGELVCLVGPNGAGKSTLINTIAGLNRITAGKLSISGRDLASLPAHRFVSEGIMTVRENLELGSLEPAAKARRRDSLERACTMFPAIADNMQRLAGALSGGQQQMVAIARALMARPRLLLLDEPSLGLAPAIVIELFVSIRRINAEGTAVLLVEQNVTAALDLSSRAYVLDEGRIVAQGSPQELLAQQHIHRAYLGIESDAN